MRALGVSEADITATAERHTPPDDFEVYACNVVTVQAFQRLGRSWFIVAAETTLIHTGLRAEAIESVLRLMDVPKEAQLDVFDGLRVMEGAALEVLNER